MIAKSIKRHLHHDICRDPVLHGLVLNMYLNGEEYPHRIDDYFPVWAVADVELLAAMKSHMQDEDKHVAIYRKAIRKIDQPVIMSTTRSFAVILRSLFVSMNRTMPINAH